MTKEFSAPDAPILYEVEDGIACITLNRPETRNALTAEMRDGLFAAFERFQADASAFVAILTGAGSKAFCAGADLKEFAGERGNSPVGPVGTNFVPMPGRNIRVDKPWIAAVNGYAFAAGFLYTMLADLAVAAESATFAIPESRIGRGAPWSIPLLHQVSSKVWFELAATGRPIDAERAERIGLVNRIVPNDQLLRSAREMASDLVTAAPQSVLATLKSVRYATQTGNVGAAWDYADEAFVRAYTSSDAIEGPRAWAERREPQWQR